MRGDVWVSINKNGEKVVNKSKWWVVSDYRFGTLKELECMSLRLE